MSDLNAVANEVFQVLRSFDYTLNLYDENGMSIAKPEDARRMLAHPKNLMVSLVDDDDNSRITLHMGKSTHINDVLGLDQKLRTLATKYNMIFRAQQYGKVISPKHFAELASITEREDIRMQVCEGMYGTSKSSYLQLENARMIVRHTKRIDDSQIGARGRCVESIFVESAVGERFLMPTNNLMAGRAMTQHFNQAGAIGDPVGQQITGMAQDYSNLGIGAQAAVTEDAGPVREACRTKRGKLRKTLERLSRPTSYAAEAADIMTQTSLLNETETVSDVRLNELHVLLGGDHAREVYECCCKALDEMQIDEMRKPVPTVSVVGQKIAVPAWEAFKGHVVEISQMPVFRETGFKSLIHQISYRLAELAPKVKDDSLANLLGFIAEQLPEETDEQKRQKYRLIAVHALRAVNAMPQRLADKNPTVAEHVGWLNCFDPDRVLTEVAWSPMDPSFPHDLYDHASESALREFDANEFVDSPEMQDIINGVNPHDPEENHLTRDEIVAALESYLRHYVETYNSEFTDSGFEDTAGMADAVYDTAVEALHARGFVIDDITGLEENSELTIEDVLLPKQHQGDDLAGEVTKADVTDPDDPDGHGKASSAYVSRLQILGGMKNLGQNGPSY